MSVDDDAWWSLAGPRGFTSDVLALAMKDIAVVRAPDPRPQGMIEALCHRFSRDLEARSVVIDAARGGPGHSIAHGFAETCGLDEADIGRVADLVRAPRMGDTAFVIDALPAAELGRWTGFLRAMVEERRKVGPRIGPYLTVFLPLDAAGPERSRLCGGTKPVTWIGRVSRFDATAWLGALDSGNGIGLLDRLAAATIVEVAAWSRDLLETLARWRLEDRLDPRPGLAALADAGSRPTPHLENGLVDLWDGFPLVHAAAHPDPMDEVGRRIWTAQVSVLLPLLDRIRRGVIRNHLKILARLATPQEPYVKIVHERNHFLTSPWEFEWYELHQELEGTLTTNELKFLETCRQIRHRTAHAVVIGVEELRDFSRQIEANDTVYGDDLAGRESGCRVPERC